MTRARTVTAVVVMQTLTAGAAAHDLTLPVAEGEHLHVVDAGEGEPVVLLPGLLGSAYAFRELQARLVRGGYRVVIVEPLGFGGSTGPATSDYSLTAQADRVAAVLAARRIERAVVVAHAVGGSIALRLAYRHPQRVRAVVSLDGGPAESAATPGLRRALRFAFLLKLFGGDERIKRTVRSSLQERSADPAWVTEDVLAGYVAGAGPSVGDTLRTLRQMAKAPEPEKLVPRLGDVRCPVWLLIGDAPPPVRGISDADIEVLTAGLHRFQVDTVRSAGHFLFEEEPGAVVAAIVRAFASTFPAPRVASQPAP